MKTDLDKKTLNFRPGDFERLRDIYPEVPPSIVIRKLVSNFVDKFNREGNVNLPKVEVDL